MKSVPGEGVFTYPNLLHKILCRKGTLQTYKSVYFVSHVPKKSQILPMRQILRVFVVESFMVGSQMKTDS